MTAVMRVAQNRWHEILAHFGIPETHLKNRHGPCPICGGKDRYRFDNIDGNGTYFCSKCGPGNGISLLMKFMKWDDFYFASNVVIEYANGAAPRESIERQQKDGAMKKNRKLIDEILRECDSIQDVPEAMSYLAARKLHHHCNIHAHKSLAHYDAKTKERTFHPAIVASVTNQKGHITALHRVYLFGGTKKARKMTPKCNDSKNIQIELFPMAERMGIAEGIETAIAANILFKIPVWSVINAYGMEIFEPPEMVKTLFVFGDNDKSYTGQASAFECAKRMNKKGIQVRVEIPSAEGDWNDVLMKGK